MKRIIFLLLSLCFVLSLCTVPATAQGRPEVSAGSAALMSVDTGELLYAKNENERRSMASTTKIMTSLIALENDCPQMEIVVTEDMLQVEGTSMGLLPGDSVTLQTLVYGMLLQSGNDAANVTALTLGGSIEGFAELMNKKAAELGMSSSHFVTPSGLDAEEHYSTAYDMALLGCAAMKNPCFAAVCSQRSAALYYGNPPYRRTLTNHNRLLRSYSGAVGIKTGFTKKSGRCLVSAAERDGVLLVAVTLNAPNDWEDHRAMLDYGFSQLERRVLDCDISSVSLKIAGGEKSRAGVELAREPYAVMRVSEEMEVRPEILIKRFEYAPTQRGEVVGEARFYAGEELIDSVPLLCAEDVAQVKTENKPKQEEPEKSGFFSRLIEKLRSHFKKRK